MGASPQPLASEACVQQSSGGVVAIYLLFFRVLGEVQGTGANRTSFVPQPSSP